MVKVIIRPWAQSDCDYIYRLQCHQETRRFSRNPKVPAKEEHQKWFFKYINNPANCGYIILFEEAPCGFVRVDQKDKLSAEISIVIDKPFWGKGIAGIAINLACQLSSVQKFIAVINKKNISSVKLFKKMGFVFNKQIDSFFEEYSISGK